MPVIEFALDHRHLERKLRDRRDVLRGEISAALLPADAETYGDLAGQLQDTEEESLAELLTDVSLGALSRDVPEARDIDAALARIAGRTYGLCSDCGEPIGAERLEAYPTAKPPPKL